jgi:hypothetical protein
VVTLSGQKATIEVGQEVQDSEGHPRHVGARVEILPTLNDGEIHLAIHARNTRVIPATADKPQSFAEREIRTQISVKPGDTLVVDTLEQDQDPDTARRLLFTARARLSDGGDAERARLEKIIIPQIEFNDVGLSDALAFLRTKAREHDSEKKGVNLIYKPRAETPEPRLTVSFKEIPLTEALKYFAQLAALDLEFSEAAVVLDERSARMTGSPTSQPKGMSQDLASRLILPQVEFKEASLPKILQFLQQKSLELDPEKKGLNLILNAPGDPSPETIQISLHLREVPLSEALRYVAKLANLNLRYDDDAVVLFRD